MKEKLKSRKKRTASSRQWLTRQINDPYVQQAKADGYRSRAAYKLVQIQEKYKILKPGQMVVDLGAAPGGWTQVCVKILGENAGIIGIDLQEMEEIPGATVFQGDFSAQEDYDRLLGLIPGGADVILSDMAAAACGIQEVDHTRIMHLVELVYDFCLRALRPKGHMVAKVLRGGTEAKLLAQLKKDFTTVQHFKPAASRADSAEMYVVARGFRKE